MTALVAAGAAGQVSERGRTMGDLGPWAPLLGALGILAGGWFALRKNWDSRLLDAMQRELTEQRDEIRTMGAEIKTLRHDLETLRQENNGLQGQLRTAVVERDRLARVNVMQARRLVIFEANFARVRVYCESLVARLRLLGEEPGETPAFEDHNGEEIGE